MGDAVLEDFRAKDCAFVANLLRRKGLSNGPNKKERTKTQ